MFGTIIFSIITFMALIGCWFAISMVAYKEDEVEYSYLSERIVGYNVGTRTKWNLIVLYESIKNRKNDSPVDADIDEIQKEIALLEIQKDKLTKLEGLKKYKEKLLEEVDS